MTAKIFLVTIVCLCLFFLSAALVGTKAFAYTVVVPQLTGGTSCSGTTPTSTRMTIASTSVPFGSYVNTVSVQVSALSAPDVVAYVNGTSSPLATSSRVLIPAGDRLVWVFNSYTMPSGDLNIDFVRSAATPVFNYRYSSTTKLALSWSLPAGFSCLNYTPQGYFTYESASPGGVNSTTTVFYPLGMSAIISNMNCLNSPTGTTCSFNYATTSPTSSDLVVWTLLFFVFAFVGFWLVKTFW